MENTAANMLSFARNWLAGNVSFTYPSGNKFLTHYHPSGRKFSCLSFKQQVAVIPLTSFTHVKHK